MLRILFFSAMVLLASAVLQARPQASFLQHGIVDHEAGRFAGWPANRGIWSWGDEIAVGYVRGWFKHDPDEHSRDRDRPIEEALSRSMDGGMTWSLESLALPQAEARPVPDAIDFAHPDFALLVRDHVFYYSHDRARTWRGPFLFPDFKLGEKLTARTDYIVNSTLDCLIFLSVRDEQVQSGIPTARSLSAPVTAEGPLIFSVGWPVRGRPWRVPSCRRRSGRTMAPWYRFCAAAMISSPASGMTLTGSTRLSPATTV